jgi:hypothetical protein
VDCVRGDIKMMSGKWFIVGTVCATNKELFRQSSCVYWSQGESKMSQGKSEDPHLEWCMSWKEVSVHVCIFDPQFSTN